MTASIIPFPIRAGRLPGSAAPTARASSPAPAAPLPFRVGDIVSARGRLARVLEPGRRICLVEWLGDHGYLLRRWERTANLSPASHSMPCDGEPA